MNVYNPTCEMIESQANGKQYNIPPFSGIDIWEKDHLKIILKNSAYRGLVHMIYNDEMQKKYKTFEDFKADQIKFGLINYKSFCREVWINERQAEVDVKHKAGSEADKSMIDADKFKKKMDAAEKLLEDLKKNPLQASERSEVSIDVPRRGRRRKVIGQVNHSHESQTAVG